jgi:ribosomal protein S18 acetylase RimI-like enzyme
MPEIEIRPAVSTDYEQLFRIDLSNRTEYVWQMDRLIEEGQITIGFREVRLPRAIQVEHPHPKESLMKAAQSSSGVLVAVLKGLPVGYIILDESMVPSGVWIRNLAVAEEHRRQGIGSALLISAQEWAIQRRLRKIFLETQSKNYPAIRLAVKLGFELSGYNDRYYANQDIALFFSRLLR